MLNILVAYDRERAIGKDNDLPWGRGLPSDLKRFKYLTLGRSVIMGRNTWESLPPTFRPLPGRENIVLSRNPDYQIEDALCVTSLALAVKAASAEPFVVGGAQVYDEALAQTNRIYATEVHETFPDTDTFFPVTAPEQWHEVSREQKLHSVESGDTYDFDFVVYDRLT